MRFQEAYVEGIAKLAALDIRYAEELGYRIKLLGITKRTARGIELREPTTFARELAHAVADARLRHRMQYPRVGSMRPPRSSWRPKVQGLFRST